MSTGRADESIDFDRDIRPLLSNTCYTCHGPDANKREADLRFDDKNSVFAARNDYFIVVPGMPDRSELIRRITSDDPDERMPPADSHQQLTAAQIDLLTRWVRSGAEWQQHWSFAPLLLPDVPEVADADWATTPLDKFVAWQHQQRGLPHSAPAAKETLLRRVTLDLTGLPPTLAEMDAFLADDSPQAYETVVDRLFMSPRYGEHMALAWLEAARYADSNGYQQDRTRTMWPWRDWVIRAMNDNMPFDEFTILQIAGDLLANADVEQFLPTGFHRNHMLNGEGGRIAEESRVDYVFDRVDTTATVWLGLTMGCARCHDHKYDPISQKDFYRMFASFNNIDESGGVDADGNAKPVMKVPTGEQWKQELAIDEALAKLNSDLEQLPTDEELLAWEVAQRAVLEAGDTQPYWHLATPVAMASENGQSMEVRSDGTILVTGKNPETDNYRITFHSSLTGITGMRVEAVPHAAFTNGAFARSNSGNFVLTHIALTGAAIARSKADFEQGSLTVERSYDGNQATGWAVWTGNGESMKQPRNAMYAFATPLAGGDLTLEMNYQSANKFHNLSSFRIYFTTRVDPQLDGKTGLPELVISALNTPREQRDARQLQALRNYYRETAPAAAALRNDIAAQRTKLDEVRKAYPESMVMRDRATPRETYRLERGAWDQPDKSERIFPNVPECLPPVPADAPPNRLTLARWLVDPAQPLTPRVFVNRQWQHFFGAGLVKTVEDFGSQGERPSHPALFDWLAADFVQSGWNVKRLQKQIVMSATYRQSSVLTPELLEQDPSNQFLTRGPRFRLTSQAIRDQALALGDLLVEQVGGPPVYPYQPLGIWSDLSLGKIQYKQDHGDSLYRRSLYTYWRRASGPTTLFDTAARQVCTVRQYRTNTPLHALVLLNDTTFVEAARKFSERVMKSAEKPEDRLALAFRMATARMPNDAERQRIIALYEQLHQEYTGDPEAAKKLLAVGESPHDSSLDVAESAASTAIMMAILNLDEVVTKE